MRTNALTIGLAAAGLLALTACGGSDGKPNAAPGNALPATTAAAKTKVDCTDPGLSQADWIANCGDKAGGNDHLQQAFGKIYSWPDGVKVTVTEARRFTDYNTDYGETPDVDDFRIKVRVTNGGHAPFDLADLSTIIEGATSGGEAATTTFTNGSSPLEGRVAPGVTVVKTDDNNLEAKYGKKIVVTVQRMTGGDVQAFPEFSGAITG